MQIWGYQNNLHLFYLTGLTRNSTGAYEYHILDVNNPIPYTAQCKF